jgi:hypothetical protein
MLGAYYRSVFYGLSRIRTCKAVRQPIYSRFEIANSQSTRYKIPPGTVCRAGGIYPFSTGISNAMPLLEPVTRERYLCVQPQASATRRTSLIVPDGTGLVARSLPC